MRWTSTEMETGIKHGLTDRSFTLSIAHSSQEAPGSSWQRFWGCANSDLYPVTYYGLSRHEGIVTYV